MFVSVTDTGAGISPHDQIALFEAFHQCGGPNEEGNGVGLGLAIVKGLVEQHGGRIWVESEPGAGSKFLFTLPPAHEPRVKGRRSDPVFAELAMAG